MTRWVEPVVLRDEHACLEPLSPDHIDALAAATADGELWRLWYTSVPAPAQVPAYVEDALAACDRGVAMPFAVRDVASDTIVGATRYCNIDASHHRLEIGYTWYAARVQRTALNSACKLLLLRHAFEALGAIAVEFRTHWHNQRSRAAIARLGAKQDGVLRNHQRLADGSLRDTVVFSIIDAEWPAVRRNLEYRLDRTKV